MYLYGFLYKAVCAYEHCVNICKHMLYDPVRRVMRDLMPDNAIQKAVVINILENKEKVLYKYCLADMMWHLFLMYFVHGVSTWTRLYKHRYFVYQVGKIDHNAPYSYIHVTLANGKEYIVRDVFDSCDLHMYKSPKARYLCIMLDNGTVNITRFIKRFWESWNFAGMRVMDIVLLAMHLDPQVRLGMRNRSSALEVDITTVDDDTFTENVFQSGDIFKL